MTWVIDRAGNPMTLQVTPEMEAGAGKLALSFLGIAEALRLEKY